MSSVRKLQKWDTRNIKKSVAKLPKELCNSHSKMHGILQNVVTLEWKELKKSLKLAIQSIDFFANIFTGSTKFNLN